MSSALLQPYSTYPVQVPANSSRTINVTGNFVGCVTSDQAEFRVGTDEGPTRVFMAAGVKATLPPGAPLFRKVTIQNPNGAALNAVIVAGAGFIDDSRFSTSGTLLVSGTVAVSSIASPVSISGRINENTNWDASRVVVGSAASVPLFTALSTRRVIRVGAGALDLSVARGTGAVVGTPNGWVIPAGEWQDLEISNTFLQGQRLAGDGAAICYLMSITGA